VAFNLVGYNSEGTYEAPEAGPSVPAGLAGEGTGPEEVTLTWEASSDT
jgi:hypothetical protein